jgi:hypothetical protein
MKTDWNNDWNKVWDTVGFQLKSELWREVAKEINFDTSMVVLKCIWNQSRDQTGTVATWVWRQGHIDGN